MQRIRRLPVRLSLPALAVPLLAAVLALALMFLVGGHVAHASAPIATSIETSPTPGPYTAGTGFPLTLTLKDAVNTLVDYNGDLSLSFSGLSTAPDTSHHATATDKNATDVDFGAGTVVTFVHGVGTTTVRAYSAESNVHVHITGGGASGDTVPFSVTDAGPARLGTTGYPAGPLTAGTSFTLTLTATDAYGNGVGAQFAGGNNTTFGGLDPAPNGNHPTATNIYSNVVDFGSFTPIDFSNSGSTTITAYRAQSGVHVTIVSGKGTPTGNIVISGQTGNFDVAPAALSAIYTDPVANQTAGAGFTLTVAAKDAYGNIATSYAGLKTLTFGGLATAPDGTHKPTALDNSASPVAFGTPTSVQFTGGVAAITVVPYAAEAAVHVTVGAGSGLTAQTNNFAVQAAPANTFVTSVPGPTYAAGSSFTVTMTAKDAYGNVSSSGPNDFDGDKALTFGGLGTAPNTTSVPTATDKAAAPVHFGSATTVAFAHGAGTATVTAYRAESNVHVHITGGGASGDTGPFSVTDAGPSRFNTTGYPTAPLTAGTSFTLTLTATDAYGNGVGAQFDGGNNTEFGGLDPAPYGNNPTATDLSSTAVNFGVAASIDFINSGGSTTITAYKAQSGVHVTIVSVKGTPTGSIVVSGQTGNFDVAPAAVSAIYTDTVANQTAGAGFTLTVTAKDAYGNIATSYAGLKTLTFGGLATAPDGTHKPVALDNSASLVAFGTPTAVQFTGGVAAITVVPVAVEGPVHVTVAGSGLTVRTNDFAVQPGPANTIITAATGPTYTAGGSFTVTMTAKDAYGNVSSNGTNDYDGTKNLTFTGLGTAPNATSVPTATNSAATPVHFGTATAVAFSHGAGSTTVRPYKAESPVHVTIAGGGGVSGQTSDFTVLPAPAAAIAFPPAAPSYTAGAGFSLIMTATDAYGNAAPDYGGTIHFTSSDAGAVLPADYTYTLPDHGAHQFTGIILKAAGNQTLSAADTAIAGIAGGSLTLPVSAAAAVSLQVEPASTAVLTGSPLAVKVTARDTYGNVANGYTGTVHFTSSDATAMLPADYTFTSGTGAGLDNGVHTFTVKLRGTGGQWVKAQDTLTATINGTGGNVTVYAPAPSPYLVSIAVAGPTQVVAGGTGAFNAAGTSSMGTGYGAPFTWSATGGTISAGAWTAPTAAGTYTVTATFAGVTGTLTVQVVHGPVHTLALAPGKGATLQAGQAQAFTYTAADSYGNAITDGRATWSVSGAGSVSSSGSFSSTQAGTATVTVSMDGQSAGSGTLTITPAAPAKVTVTGAGVQFKAAVADQYGNPITDAAVTWSATGGTIDARGRFTAGSTALGATVTATAGGVSGTAQVAIAGPPPAFPITSPGKDVSPSVQLAPPGAIVLAGPGVIAGNGQAEAHFNVSVPSPGSTTLAYYFSEHLAAWIAVPTSFTLAGAVATVPGGAPIALLQGTVAEPTDVSGSDWAASYILKLQSLGLVSGFPDGSFQPEAPVTRYQIARVLALAAHLDVAHPDLSVLGQFADRDQMPDWAQPYVAAAVKAGLMTGTGGAFNGGGGVTRAQAATIIGRLLGSSAPPASLDFSDTASIPAWAQAGVARCVAAGIMAGFPDHTFRPDAALTRAEMAKLVSLLLDRLAAR